MGSFAGKSVLVTGASEGIGRALALRLARDGARLTLVARSADRLGSLRDECEALGAEALAVPADLEEAAPAKQVVARLMRINYLAPVRLTAAALPALREARGLIVAVASVAGLTGVPERTGYAASKHAMVGFFESLRIELAGSGVDVTIVAPDFVVSQIHRRALGADGRALGASPMQESRIMTAERCAGLIHGAMLERRRLLITSWRGRAGRWLRLVAPTLVDRMAARAIRTRS